MNIKPQCVGGVDDHDDEHSGSPFPWLLFLLIVLSIGTVCGIGWGVFFYVGKNMGDSDRRRNKNTGTKVRGGPVNSKQLQMKQNFGGRKAGGGGRKAGMV